MIVTMIDRPEERQRVDAFASRAHERVTHASTWDDALKAAESRSVGRLIIDLALLSEVGSAELARRLADRADPLVVHLMHEMSPRAVAELPMLALAGSEVRALYRPYHDLAEQLEVRPPRGLPSATVSILEALYAQCPDDIAAAFVCLVVVCERRTTFRRFARQFGKPDEELRALLRPHAFPRFSRVRGVLRIAHGIHRIERLDVSVATAADCGGFASGRHFENFVSGHFGLTPNQLMKAGGFDLVLTEIRTWFVAC